MKGQKSELYFTLIVYASPILFWGIIILIYYCYGFEMVFKSIFNILLGILYAYGSFICAFYYNKLLRCEKLKDSHTKQIEFNNKFQYDLELSRRDNFITEYSKCSIEYHGAARMLYILQGIIAIAVSIEIVLGWA
jgi:hypothetical protein